MTAPILTVKFAVADNDLRRITVPTTTTLRQLQEKLKEIASGSFDSSTLIQYYDDEGDLVSVTTDEELKEAFRQATTGVLRLVLKQPQSTPHLQEQQQYQLSGCYPSAPTENTTMECDTDWHCDNKKDEKKSGPVIHAAFCDNCGEVICGIRYKCVNCSDYDLCAACEAQNVHNSTHLFLKIKKPIPNSVDQQRVLLPNLYEEVTSPCAQSKESYGRCPWFRSNFSYCNQNSSCHYQNAPLCDFFKRLCETWCDCCINPQQRNSCCRHKGNCNTQNASHTKDTSYCSSPWDCGKANNVIVDTSDNKIDENKQQRQQGANEFSMNKQSQLYANIDNSVKIEDTSTTYSESRYEHHLKQLQDMGFVDRELNLRDRKSVV